MKIEQLLTKVMEASPDAMAWMKGSAAFQEIEGCVLFYGINDMTFVVVSLSGLYSVKIEKGENCNGGFLGFHIHGGNECSGTVQEPFANAGTHFNPKNCFHPFHAGDLPPVLIADGNAFYAVLTAGFTPDEIRGRTVILHAGPDDFKTQPSGNSGAMIACGKIV